MSDDARELRVAHHHPGRLRLRARAFLGDAPAARRAARALREIPGVAEVTASALTGSLLIAYDPERAAPDALVDAAARAAELVVTEDHAKPGDEEHLIDVAIDVARGLNAFASELTGHRADLRFLVPAALAGLGVYSFAIDEDRLPRWDSLLYWAYSVFSMVNRREIDERTEEPAERAP